MKNFLKNNKPTIIYVLILILTVAVVVFCNLKPTHTKNEQQQKSGTDTVQNNIEYKRGEKGVSNNSDKLPDNAETTESKALQEDSPEQNADSQITEDENTNTFKVVVDCRTILNFSGKKKHDINIPEGGILYDISGIAVQEDKSAFELILKEFNKRNIKIDYEKSSFGNSVYLTGVNGIKEFDCGNKSGWLYKINGEFPSKSLDECTVKPGDLIELIYTCDMGNDI